jgi:hypothetical protein
LASRHRQHPRRPSLARGADDAKEAEGS